MNPMRELAWHERQFVALVIGGLPACIIGFFFGLWGNEIGGRELDPGTVLLRGGYCSVFPVILAWIIPRAWIPLALTYAVGFCMGFGFLFSEGLRGLGELIVTPVYWLEGKRIIASPPSNHPDLPWILGLAFWLSGLTSILRRSFRFTAMLRRMEIHPD